LEASILSDNSTIPSHAAQPAKKISNLPAMPVGLSLLFVLKAPFPFRFFAVKKKFSTIFRAKCAVVS
jgi:hypothetical protein